jgi:diacylglycerol kinase family enzyme
MNAEKPDTVTVIANPGAGRREDVIGPLADAFAESRLTWHIEVTGTPDDTRALARKAVKQGARIVVAYGGDGTVSAVAGEVAGTHALLGILPGGTGNVMALELGIPNDLDAAARLLTGPHDTRVVDLGVARFDDGSERVFVLRTAIGLEATAVEESGRDDKERFGDFAYFITALRQMKNPPVAKYVLTSGDGGRAELEGLFAVLCNSGHTGTGDSRYAPDISIDDGILDGVIAPATVADLVGAAAVALSGGQSELVRRLSGTELRLACDPPQRVTVDGEAIAETPVTVTVRPSALRVIVPPKGEHQEETK